MRELIVRLLRRHGSMGIREAVAITFVRPTCQWAACLCESPPTDYARLLLRSIVRSNGSWWCIGRFWADRVLLHPLLGTAVYAFAHFDRVARSPSRVPDVAIRSHAGSLQLDIFSERGRQQRRQPNGAPMPLRPCGNRYAFDYVVHV